MTLVRRGCLFTRSSVQGDINVRPLLEVGTLALFTVLVAVPAAASPVWNEINAGQLPVTAEITTGTGPLSQIKGNLDFDLNSLIWDVDLYEINIVDAATFSASTEASGANMDDPALYLFDLSGLGVYMNNDNTTADFQSTLPAAHSFGPVSPGLYYLAIAWGFSDPQDATGNSIFSLDQFLDTTGVYGPTGPGGGGALGSWTAAGPVNFDLPSNYTINLTGARAAIPEPATLALLLAAAAGAFAGRRRRH